MRSLLYLFLIVAQWVPKSFIVEGSVSCVPSSCACDECPNMNVFCASSRAHCSDCAGNYCVSPTPSPSTAAVCPTTLSLVLDSHIIIRPIHNQRVSMSILCNGRRRRHQLHLKSQLHRPRGLLLKNQLHRPRGLLLRPKQPQLHLKSQLHRPRGLLLKNQLHRQLVPLLRRPKQAVHQQCPRRFRVALMVVTMAKVSKPFLVKSDVYPR